MYGFNSLSVNPAGTLTVGGVSVMELVKTYGTPLYIMDEDEIRRNCRLYTDSLKASGLSGCVAFASKAFSCRHIYEVLEQEGLCVDVVSGGELYTAKMADFPMERVYYHGNCKQPEELDYAMSLGVGKFVADGFEDYEEISHAAERAKRRANVLFRIKPGVEAHTHEFILTGNEDSKFGLDPRDALRLIAIADNDPHTNLVGVHCHIGSQIFDAAPFEHAVKVLLNFIADLRDNNGILLQEINLGGGFGIRYTDDDKPLPLNEYYAKVADVLREESAKRNFPVPYLAIEPGRSLVGSAGFTAYKICAVKDTEKRRYIAVDGGMGDNPRPTLYDAVYDALLVENPDAPRTQTVTVSGRYCETDMLIKDIEMPELKKGQHLVVLGTGAYNYAMASNYNRVPRPPIAFVANGSYWLAVRRETYEDVVKCDL